jgi:hypothetical protein
LDDTENEQIFKFWVFVAALKFGSFLYHLASDASEPTDRAIAPIIPELRQRCATGVCSPNISPIFQSWDSTNLKGDPGIDS